MRVGIFLVLVFALTSETWAQHEEGFALRFQLGYGKGTLSGNVNSCDISTPNGNVLCPSFVSYTGAHATVSLGLEYAITKNFHLGVDGGVVSVNGTTQELGESLDVFVKGRQYTVSTSLHGTAKSLDGYPRLYVSYYLPANFIVEVGAGALINISNTMSSVVRLSTPGLVYFDSIATTAATFRNDNREVLLYRQPLQSFLQFRPCFDVSLGQSYTTSNLTIQIMARYQFAPSAHELQSLSISNLGGTLVAMYAL